jgi:hypothetical protein
MSVLPNDEYSIELDALDWMMTTPVNLSQVVRTQAFIDKIYYWIFKFCRIIYTSFYFYFMAWFVPLNFFFFSSTE